MTEKSKNPEKLRNPINGQYVGNGIKGVGIISDVRKQELDKIIEVYAKDLSKAEKPIPVDISFDRTTLVADIEHGGEIDIHHHHDFNVEDFAVKIAVFIFLLFAIWYTYLKIKEMIP